MLQTQPLESTQMQQASKFHGVYLSFFGTRMCSTNPMGTPYFLLTRSSDSREEKKIQKLSKPYGTILMETK